MERRLTDIELWNAFKAGDDAAFENLFNKFYRLLYQYGSKFCPDKGVLEDCIQNLFLELWQSKSQTPVNSVKVYFLKAIKYKIYRAINNNGNGHKDHLLPDDLAFEFSHENFIVDKEEDKENLDRLVTCLQQLPNRQREIIYLKIYKNLGYEEVAELMQINYQAARNLLYQAIKNLKEHFNSLSVH